ncbi:YifB family Mg chelatase-like AAA ATPase [Microbacterium sp.]|uniref:YifB family Mg chelatase-like AAA ATPase n=1 Tax=Microbacterium sp. TaxID=51671 RepID=UPI003A8961A1
MTLPRTWAVALTGLVGDLVEVEADVSSQTPEFQVIGLADRAIGEARQRVRGACANSDLPLPRRRLTVSLTPADLPKHGSALDLAIALASLATELPLDRASLFETVHIGELGLDGRLRPVAGVLPAVMAAARAGFRRVIVPYANGSEAALVGGIEVLAAVGLREVAARHGLALDDVRQEPVAPPTPSAPPAPSQLDLAEIVGQREAVEALVVAAAGGHHLMMSGPPGAGKTMLARRLPGILPELDDRAALQVAAVRSLSGQSVTALHREPPFEAPHHTASTAALIGGGSRTARPGAIARASGGVLFLDEAGEYSAQALDALRQPLESGSIEIHRAGFRASFPARFQLVLATNPCPCGNYGVTGSVCECAPYAIRRYAARLSGPLRDRIDIELGLRPVSSAAPTAGPGQSSAHARERVANARRCAAARLRDTPWRLNVDVPGSWLRAGPCAPPAEVRRPLDDALRRGALTLRGYDRVLRVAWSCVDLDGRERLSLDDVGRALYLKKGIAA